MIPAEVEALIARKMDTLDLKLILGTISNRRYNQEVAELEKLRKDSK